MKLNQIDYQQIGNVNPTTFNLSDTLKGIESVKQARSNNKITLAQIQEHEAAKQIIQDSKDLETGVVDIDKAISNLSNAGLMDYASKAIEYKNKGIEIKDKEADFTRQENQRKGMDDYNRAISEGVTETIPGAKNKVPELPSENPDDYNYNPILGEPDKTTKRPLTIEEKINLSGKIPANNVAEVNSNLQTQINLEKERQGGAEKIKNDKLDWAYNHVFGMPDVQVIYKDAQKLWGSGKGTSEEKQAAQDKLLSVIESADDVDGSTKALLQDRIKKTFHVPGPTMEEAIAKAQVIGEGNQKRQIEANEASNNNAQKKKIEEEQTDINGRWAAIDAWHKSGSSNPQQATDAMTNSARMVSNEALNESDIKRRLDNASPGVLNQINSWISNKALGTITETQREQIYNAAKLVYEAKKEILAKKIKELDTKPAPGSSNPAPGKKKSAHDWTKDL